MTLILIEFLIVLIGLAATAVLFHRFPALPEIKPGAEGFPAISVIIPARNEENNLPLLLEDLRAQTWPALEIICADDSSEDATPQIALSYGAKLISLPEKPDGWTGKSWACQNGAQVARGEVLLFLDADVRLGKSGLRKLAFAYSEYGCTVSVQPYHTPRKLYEQLSMIFNLIQIAANGTALPKPLNIGLYGPVILIAQSDYWKVGGHASVRKSVVEDMALGLYLKKAGLPFRLFIGDQDIAFRMYGGGLRSLFQGWAKNMAAGASRTPARVFWMVFFWIASLISVPLQLVKFAVLANIAWLAVYLTLYAVWVFILIILTRRVGRFQIWAFILYPISMLMVLGVFAVSMTRKMLGLKSIWKGRPIGTKE